MTVAHDPYFAALSDALREAGVQSPTLVVDRDRLLQNVACVRDTVSGGALAVRIVVKSLPAHDLIDFVADGVGTHRFMVFNRQTLLEMALRRPHSDFLLGKPLPVGEAARALPALGPVAPQWLIDTPARLAEYAALARESRTPLRVSLEIDIGLRRGGFESAEDVARAAAGARAAGLTVSGLMGYDPHVAKAADPVRAYGAARRAYAAAKAAVLEVLGRDAAGLDWNAAGSPTYTLHAQGTEGSEVAIGSAFVKPADFDLASLQRHLPAAFVATPVLKAFERGAHDGPLALHADAAGAVFIHGGNWLADPVFPAGLRYSPVYGRSSNQELLISGPPTGLKPDDIVFLRPRQSEALFLQFGPIAVYDGGRIVEFWPTFPPSA